MNVTALVETDATEQGRRIVHCPRRFVTSTKTRFLWCLGIGLVTAASAVNCKESATSEDTADREVPPDLSRMETVLRGFLAAHAEELKGMLTGVDVFAGPRQEVDANAWRLGQWTITRSPEGFWATVSIDMYRSERELEVFIVRVKVDHRDEGLTVADWTTEMKRGTRVNPPGSEGH